MSRLCNNAKQALRLSLSTILSSVVIIVIPLLFLFAFEQLVQLTQFVSKMAEKATFDTKTYVTFFKAFSPNEVLFPTLAGCLLASVALSHLNLSKPKIKLTANSSLNLKAIERAKAKYPWVRIKRGAAICQLMVNETLIGLMTAGLALELCKLSFDSYNKGLKVLPNYALVVIGYIFFTSLAKVLHNHLKDNYSS